MVCLNFVHDLFPDLFYITLPRPSRTVITLGNLLHMELLHKNSYSCVKVVMFSYHGMHRYPTRASNFIPPSPTHTSLMKKKRTATRYNCGYDSMLTAYLMMIKEIEVSCRESVHDNTFPYYASRAVVYIYKHLWCKTMQLLIFTQSYS